MSLLIDYCRGGNIEGIKQIIKYDPDAISMPDYDGNTPLIWAANDDETEIVKILLANNANVNITNYFGQSPLFFAANRGNTKTVKILLASGANINQTDINGATPLTATMFGNSGSVQTVNLLLKNGANINDDSDKFGRTPLMWAVSYGLNEIIKILINNGANVMQKGKSSITALEYAMHFKFEDTVYIIRTQCYKIILYTELSTIPMDILNEIIKFL